jgi:hypothetical protein
MHQFKEHGFPENVTRPNAQRRQHLELLNRVRLEEPQPVLDWGKLMLSIPPLDWAVLRVRFPELESHDPQIMKMAWNVFMRHPASEPYRVHYKNKARN